MSFHSFLAIAMLVTGLASAASAQARGPGRAPTGTPPQVDTMSRAMVMLSGNIVTDDGSSLPSPAFIERTCSGHVTRDGRSDFKGFFTITVSSGPQLLSNSDGSAEIGGGNGLNTLGTLPAHTVQGSTSFAGLLAGCELRASLAGFRSSSVTIPPGDLGSSVGPVSVGTIVIQRLGKDEGVTVSATSLNAPKDAKKAYDKGHQALNNNKLPEAEKELEKAVETYPHYAAAWLDLGWLYSRQEQFDKAQQAFGRASAADAMFVPAYVGLASVELHQAKWSEAAESSARATQLDSVSFPAAFYYNSLANYELGNFEQAQKSAHKAEMLGAQSSFPQLHLLLAAMLGRRSQYADAADQLRAYLKAVPAAANAGKVRQQLAEFEKLGGTASKTEAAPAAK